MSRAATTSEEPMPEPELHPLLQSRWSPTEWDPDHRMTRAEVESLLEAARWAPSAGNDQPWAFAVGCRGDDTHRRLVPHLSGSSARWAPQASLLVVNLCHRYVEGSTWDYSEFALYDLGQAVAHMTLQARSLGLQARQFRAFDRAGVGRELGLPEHWEATTMTTYGRPLAAHTPRALTTPTGEAVPRERRELDDLHWAARGANLTTDPSGRRAGG